MTVPEGAQLSEDGHYWWDGSAWQSVPAGGGTPDAAAGGTPGAAGGAAHDATDATNGATGGGLAAALEQQGIAIDPNAADAGYIQQVAEHVNSWYSGLDENSRLIVDALSAQGGDTLLGDPEVGVVNPDDPLIAAFSGNQLTLAESLEATNRALEQTA